MKIKVTLNESSIECQLKSNWFQAMLTALALSRDPSLTEGLKEIRADILIGKLKTREEVEEAIRRAVQSGKLSREALDKFLSDSGQFGFNALSGYQFSNDLCMLPSISHRLFGE